MIERIERALSGTRSRRDPVTAALKALPAETAARLFAAPLIPAAVLIPLIEHPTGTTLLLTRRTDELPDHPGQVSFPGGRMEAGDATPRHTALREAAEEIGLPPAHVRIAGYLEPQAVVTGFAVTPVVGIVTPGFEIVPDTTEVAEVFEVPFEFFFAPENCRRSRRRVRGVDVPVVEYHYRQQRIWGATAAMIDTLINILKTDN